MMIYAYQTQITSPHRIEAVDRQADEELVLVDVVVVDILDEIPSP